MLSGFAACCWPGCDSTFEGVCCCCLLLTAVTTAANVLACIHA